MINLSDFKLGVTVVDHEHEQLLGLINQLNDGTSPVAPLIEAFSAYADLHFRLEEVLMEAHQYPGKAAHLAAHDAYRRRFEGLAADALTGSRALVKTMQTFLAHWWVEHISGVDRQLARFLRVQSMHVAA